MTAPGYHSEEEMKKAQGGSYQEPAVGIPYGYPPPSIGQPSIGHGYLYPPQPAVTAPPRQQQVHYTYQPGAEGAIPSNAIYGPPQGIPLRETFFADTPAPFECPHCGTSGMTTVKSTPSLAACMACMISVVGVCFLCKGCDCLWHKQHFCQNCGEKVGEFKKTDICMVMDPPQWQQLSFALPE